jgi:hypothetical protein
MIHAQSGSDLPISGGNGKRNAPIAIHYRQPNEYVAVEYKVVGCIAAARRVEWKLLRTALHEDNGRRIEEFKIETTQTSGTQVVTQAENYYFDITECFGRP